MKRFTLVVLLWCVCLGAAPAVDYVRVHFTDGTEQTFIPATQPTPPPTTQPAPFRVSGTKIIDSNGKTFVPRGFSHTLCWGSKNVDALAYFPATGASVVRCCFGTTIGVVTPAQRKSVVEFLLSKNIIPIVCEGWDGPTKTTEMKDPAPFRATVQHWRDPGNLAWLKQYPQVILEPANEWGPNTTVWRDEWITALGQLRGDGLVNLIVAGSGNHDAPASDPVTIQTWGKDVLKADPLHNVAFSFHMYSQWATDDMPNEAAWIAAYPNTRWDVKTELVKLQAKGFCVMIGEFTTNATPQNPPAYPNPQRLMTICQELGIGWQAWMWNQDSNSLRNMVTGWQYTTEADLKDFGKLIVNDPTVGLKVSGGR